MPDKYQYFVRRPQIIPMTSNAPNEGGSVWLHQAEQISTADFSGWLYKMGGSKGGRKTWLKRWFALKRGALYYYAGKSKDAVLLGIMPIISNLCVTCHHMGITTFTSDSSVYDHGSQYAPPPVWKLSEKCKFCDREFTMTMRRHHCRNCGESVCQQDSPSEAPLPKYGFHAPVRVCTLCADKVSNVNAHLAGGQPKVRQSVIQRVTTTVEPDGSLFTLPNQFKPHMFALKNPDRELWLHCDEAKERVAWVSAIRESQTVLKGGPSNQALENHQQWSFDFKELELSEKVAEGSFGDVFKGKLWGTKVAIKTLKQLDQSDESILEDLKQEVRILSQLRHPNVVLYIGACIKPPDTCIVTEWCSRGSLYDALHDPKIHFTCKMMIDMSIGIAQGMNYLHYLEKPIIHRDLKSYNILLDKSFQVKVADFGLSFSSKKKARTKPLAADHKDTKTLQTTADLPNDIFGTPEWMAPEVMQGEHYDEKIDVYSFGVLLTELLTRQKPFSDQFKIKCYQDVFDQVLDNGAVPTIPEWSTRFIKPLVVSCLSHEPSRRPSFNDIILYLSEFLQLDENDFFLQFDIPRIMHLLADEKYQFQALGAAELAKLAFQEKFRTDEVVPEWATAGPTKDAAIDGRPYSFKDLSPDTMEKLLVTLAQLVDNKRSLVQLSACRALTCILSLLTEDNRKQYTMLVVKAHVLKHSCSIFLKDSQSLKVAASNLILAIVTVVPEAETFVGLMNQEVKILTSVISKERNVMHTAVQQKEETLRTLQGVEESINRSTLHGPAREKVAEEVKQNLQGLLQKRGAPPLKLAERPVSMRAQPPPIPASVKKSTKIQTNEKVSRS